MSYSVKAVVMRTVLTGSDMPGFLQRVATVYINGQEFFVSAPPHAKGQALDWLPHFTVSRPDGLDSEVTVRGTYCALVMQTVQEELERKKSHGNKADGEHPDGVHCRAQICMSGHVQHYDGMPFDSNNHCTRCGAACIDECSHCEEPIRGNQKFTGTGYYTLPHYCHHCGKPYPWMEELLATAHKLLEHDKKLSLEDRTELWGELQYVMSDPKADLAPAKKKLIDIRLEKATSYVREAVLDLLAKTAAEVIKG